MDQPTFLKRMGWSRPKDVQNAATIWFFLSFFPRKDPVSGFDMADNVVVFDGGRPLQEDICAAEEVRSTYQAHLS